MSDSVFQTTTGDVQLCEASFDIILGVSMLLRGWGVISKEVGGGWFVVYIGVNRLILFGDH